MLATLMSTLLALSPQDVPKEDAARLRAGFEQAQICAKATIDGDFAKVIDMTNPAAVKAGGGKKKMLKLVNEAMAEMKKEGFSFKEGKVEASKSLSRSGRTLYAVYPMKIVIEAKGSTYTGTGFLLGASDDDGKTWTYADSAMGEAAMRKYLPDIPENLKFPAKEAPVVQKTSTEKTKE